MYSCYLFLISPASVRSIPFLSFIEPIFAWNVPLVFLIFVKRSLFLPVLLFSSISFHCSLQQAFLSLPAILWNSAFRWVYLSFFPLPCTSLLFSAIWKASSGNSLYFLLLWFSGIVLITASCPMLRTSIHSSSGTLSDLLPWIYLLLPLHSQKGFDLGHTWMAKIPFFHQSLNFAIRSSWSETVSSQSCFCRLRPWCVPRLCILTCKSELIRIHPLYGCYEH